MRDEAVTIDLKSTERSMPLAPIANAAKSMVGDYNHRLTEHIVVDFFYDRKTGHFQFHFFPRVPDHIHFYPNDEIFAKRVEKVFLDVCGPNADVIADFQGRDLEQGEDRRVMAYHRDENGDHTNIMYSQPVATLWVRINALPGNLVSPDTILGKIIEGCVEASR